MNELIQIIMFLIWVFLGTMTFIGGMFADKPHQRISHAILFVGLMLLNISSKLN